MFKTEIADINAKITKLELSILKNNAGKKTKNIDKKSRDAIENLKYGINQADIWNKKAYSPIKGKKDEYEVTDLEKFGNIKNPEYSPDFLFNKARISKTGRDVNPDFIETMRDYYEYPSSVEKYNEMDPSSRYLKSLGQDVQIGRNVEPMFMQRLMDDHTSPYRQFNSLLIGEFFDKEKSKDYKEGVKSTIERWMQNNYNRKFPQTKSDEKFINKISFYAFGLENTNLEPKSGFAEQKPDEFMDDMEKQFNKLSGNGVFTDGRTDFLTPPGQIIGGIDFFKNVQARKEFFKKLCDAATATDIEGHPLELKNREGTIISAVFRNLYDENVADYFKDFVDDLGKAKLKIFLEKAFHAAAFYETYGSVISPPDKSSDLGDKSDV